MSEDGLPAEFARLEQAVARREAVERAKAQREALYEATRGSGPRSTATVETERGTTVRACARRGCISMHRS